MWPIKAGRPKKYNADNLSEIPKKPGIYRIKDEDNNFKYIGESIDVQRRMKEHKKTGKLGVSDVVEFLNTDGRASSRTRRNAERNQIERHHPELNKSTGGEGRRAKH